MTSERFILVTGGPGAGKRTLLSALAADGLPVMPEAGRAIIRDQEAIGGTALPWADRAAFAELMLTWEIRSHHAAGALAAPVLFDRGVPDVIGCLRLCGLAVPAHVEQAATLFRYNRRVFVAPPWPEIYLQDAARKHSLAEAVATCEAVTDAYVSLGYEIVLLPRLPVAERAAFLRGLIR